MVKYSEKQLDRIFSALSNRTRRDMVQRLAAKYQNASDLAREYNISFPAISKHLRVLEGANLVTVKKRGRQRIFSVNAEQLEQARAWAEYWSKFWNSSFDSLEKFLSKNN